MTDQTEHAVHIEVERDLQHDVKRVARRLGVSVPDYWRDKLLQYAAGPAPDAPAPAPRPRRVANRFVVPEQVWRTADARRAAEGLTLSDALQELARRDTEQDQ